MSTEQLVVTDNPDERRYEGRLDGVLVGICDYVLDGQNLILPHTETVPHYRGRGIADTIVAYALADAERQGLTVVPQCWFVEQYMRAHR
jgi:uncharacterized protein